MVNQNRFGDTSYSQKKPSAADLIENDVDLLYANR